MQKEIPYNSVLALTFSFSLNSQPIFMIVGALDLY
jgi:hypothetical protein